MNRLNTIKSVVTVLAVTCATAGYAQDIGEREYLNNCAQCHGASGTGDGVMRGFLNKAPADLTILQQKNNGVFPVSVIYEIINGGVATGVHGTKEMPAWGQRYRFNAPKQLGWEYSADDRDQFIRGRILALIEYLSTIQVD